MIQGFRPFLLAEFENEWDRTTFETDHRRLGEPVAGATQDPARQAGPFDGTLVHLGGNVGSQDLGFQVGVGLILYGDRFVMEDCHGCCSNGSCIIGV